MQQPAPETIPDVAACGFTEPVARWLRHALRKVNGLVLFCGPPAAGKTTSLYACIRELSRPDNKTVTLENELRGDIPHAMRLVPDPEAGLHPAVLWRSGMLAEPDVMLAEEIEDPAHLALVVRAALTGQLVLSERRATSPRQAVRDLLALGGVMDFLLLDCLRLVVHQRRVPRVCPECRTTAPWSAAEAEELAQLAAAMDIAPASIPDTGARAAGCDACGGSGRAGHCLIAEAVHVDLASHVQPTASPPPLGEASLAEGHEPDALPPSSTSELVVVAKSDHLFHDAFRRLAAGDITLADMLTACEQA